MIRAEDDKAAHATSRGPNLEAGLKQTTLSNGLRVWCQARPDSESVAAVVVVGVGSRDETIQDNGVSHFVEHMVFAGTERWNEHEIKEFISCRGGNWNGGTDEESTAFYAQLAASDCSLALDWLSQVVFHPTFPAEKVDKERVIIFQERMGRQGRIIDALDRLGLGYELGRQVRLRLFPGSTLGLRVAGEDTSLERLDHPALLAHYRRHYVAENVTLVVVGNVEPDEAFKLADKYFGAAPRGPRPPLPATPPLPSAGPHHVVVRGPEATDQVRIMMGARTIGRAHPDRWALALLADILGDDLRRDIRYQRGLVYGLAARNAVFDDVGCFAVTTRTERRHYEAVVKTIQEHIERARHGDIPKERLDESKAGLRGSWALSAENNMDRALWLAQWPLVLPAGTPVPDVPQRLDAVQPGDLSRVVETYFTPQCSYVGLHVPIATVSSMARSVAVAGGIALAFLGSHALWKKLQPRRPGSVV